MHARVWSEGHLEACSPSVPTPAADPPQLRARVVLFSHPDPKGLPDRTPIQIGEVWENPMTGERATIVEPSQQNPERRAVANLLARVGAGVETMNRLLRQICLAGLLIALASTRVAAEVCDKGDFDRDGRPDSLCRYSRVAGNGEN